MSDAPGRPSSAPGSARLLLALAALAGAFALLSLVQQDLLGAGGWTLGALFWVWVSRRAARRPPA